MQVTSIQVAATALFGLAIVHTFLVNYFRRIAHRFSDGSIGENFFHLLSEVEIVFGVWAAIFLIFFAVLESSATALTYLESRNFSEPIFVFVVLSICSTRPVLELAEQMILFIARLLPFKRSISFLFTTLLVGPVLGSFITEPAAMTVTALILKEYFYDRKISDRLKYAILGVLFVNVSIGGTLTPYAAPPVLMVAGKWGWSLPFMWFNFGWKGALASALSALILVLFFRKEVGAIGLKRAKSDTATPIWLKFSHVFFLVGVVASSHHSVLVVGIFLFFLGFVHVTNEYQSPIRLKEGLLVSFFLGGLVVLGGFQEWWLEPVLTRLSAVPLYVGAIGLTAVTDNAALTYLGSLVPALSDASRYALVAGAVVGGGLTVIANAPNPAGYSILHPSFGEEGISPMGLLMAALPPTVISAICFWFL